MISGAHHGSPEFRQDYCHKCGAATTTKCASCAAEIRGYYSTPGVISIPRLKAPSFCYGCGKPYPWVAARILAAKAMADEISGMSDADKILLKASIDDIAADTPMTQVAVARFKKLIPKMGEFADGMRKLALDVASKTAAELLKGGG